MVGKIALSVFALSLVATVSFAAGWQRKQHELIECRIIQVVTESPETNQNSRGIPVPYTVIGREVQAETFVLPGVFGKPGQIVRIAN
jgi:hypothetical protein